MQQVFFFLKMYAFATVFCGVGFLILAFPNYPKSISQWVWFLLLVAPISLAMEFIGELLWKNKAAVAVERATEEKSFSFLRIGYGILHMIFFMGGIYGLLWALGALYDLL